MQNFEKVKQLVDEFTPVDPLLPNRYRASAKFDIQIEIPSPDS